MTAEAPRAGPAGPDRGEDKAKRQNRSRWPRWLRPVRRITKFLIFAFVVQFLVLPQIHGTRKALKQLGQVRVTYLIAGVALEAAAIVSYAMLTRAVLPREGSPSVLTLLRVQLSTLGFSHVAPGGAAAGSPLGYRLLTHAGVDGPEAGFALATQGMGSAIVLNALLWLALVVSIPVNGFNPIYLTAAIVGVVAIGAFALLVVTLTRGEERSAAVLSTIATHIPLVDHETVTELVHRVAERLRELGTDRRLLLRAAGWAAANWLLDAASLWVFVAAYGYRVSIVGLLVAFGLANVLAAIPITPGGLGVIEAVLTSTLVGFGTPSTVAILGVATYRLLNFWLPIPLGALAYLSLQVDPGDPDDTVRRRRKERLLRKLQRVIQSMPGISESGSD
ncbi:MAG: YbhN family protein [Actinomycetota bacterium]|nr:YbhN family protein [Actinomycetota bacterium]